MSNDVAAICSNCNRVTQEIFDDYVCAKCRIGFLEETLEKVNKDNQVKTEIIIEISLENESLLSDYEESMNYKIAYQVFLYELNMKNSI